MLLPLLLNLDGMFTPPVFRPVFRVEAADIFHTGQIAGTLYHTGQAAGDVFHTGQMVGQVRGD